MIFTAAPIVGAFVVDLDPISDSRGFFARSFCAREFQEYGLDPNVVQCNVSFNAHRGVLRGIHYAVPPAAEAKLVRCTAGAIYDVIVDLRRGSLSYREWFGIELTAENHRMLYIPEGVGHGFQTLTDGAEVSYQMSEYYVPEASRTALWNDPAFGIVWPIQQPIMSEKDRSAPRWAE